MIYNVRMYDNPKDIGSDYSGILFENVTEQGVIEIVQFALHRDLINGAAGFRYIEPAAALKTVKIFSEIASRK